MTTTAAKPENPTLFGHPAGLFTLFFAEMWERFSYYGMRALLVFYMIKGFLGYNDDKAYAVYGAYTALVYATPFIGGMIADRLLGARRAVVLGGLLMAAGHLLMTIEAKWAFFGALALLICGNGFFKPNISTIVGSLYPAKSTKRDGGFTIFYMGINLGAAMSPIICGYVGETYGWHYGFGLATAGMLIGVAVFVAPIRLTQVLILGGALATAIAMPFLQDTALQLAVRLFLATALAIAGIVAFVALGRGGLPDWAGAPKSMEKLTHKVGGVLRADFVVYLGALLVVPLLALLVTRSSVAGILLGVFGGGAFIWLLVEAIRSDKVERERMFVVLILMFFSMLFWAFFEQAGSSVNNFTDRNVDRVFEARETGDGETGKSIRMRLPPATDDAEIGALPLLSQEQLGMANDDPQMRQRIEQIVREEAAAKGKPAGEDLEKYVDALKKQDRLTLTGLTKLRDKATAEGASKDDQVIEWKVAADSGGMGVGGAEIPASEFQAANPIFILIFGLVFTGLWSFLGNRGWEPSIPVKFSLGLLQLGLGFGALWYGASQADGRGMVAISWLLVGYLLHTTGELCLSPVGLSMVTKLSPARIVSTVMGAWFLATAFSNFLASIIARFTGAGGHGGDGAQIIPPPVETVGVYGDVFGKIAMTAIGSAVICFLLSPLLSKWMHTEAIEDDDEPGPTEAPEPSAATAEVRSSPGDDGTDEAE